MTARMAQVMTLVLRLIETALQILVVMFHKMLIHQIMVVLLMLLVLPILLVMGKIWFILMVTWNGLEVRVQAIWMQLVLETTSM